MQLSKQPSRNSDTGSESRSLWRWASCSRLQRDSALPGPAGLLMVQTRCVLEQVYKHNQVIVWAGFQVWWKIGGWDAICPIWSCSPGSKTLLFCRVPKHSKQMQYGIALLIRESHTATALSSFKEVRLGYSKDSLLEPWGMEFITVTKYQQYFPKSVFYASFKFKFKKMESLAGKKSLHSLWGGSTLPHVKRRYTGCLPLERNASESATVPCSKSTWEVEDRRHIMKFHTIRKHKWQIHGVH